MMSPLKNIKFCDMFGSSFPPHRDTHRLTVKGQDFLSPHRGQLCNIMTSLWPFLKGLFHFVPLIITLYCQFPFYHSICPMSCFPWPYKFADLLLSCSSSFSFFFFTHSLPFLSLFRFSLSYIHLNVFSGYANIILRMSPDNCCVGFAVCIHDIHYMHYKSLLIVSYLST